MEADFGRSSLVNSSNMPGNVMSQPSNGGWPTSNHAYASTSIPQGPPTHAHTAPPLQPTSAYSRWLYEGGAGTGAAPSLPYPQQNQPPSQPPPPPQQTGESWIPGAGGGELVNGGRRIGEARGGGEGGEGGAGGTARPQTLGYWGASMPSAGYSGSGGGAASKGSESDSSDEGSTARPGGAKGRKLPSNGRDSSELEKRLKKNAREQKRANKINDQIAIMKTILESVGLRPPPTKSSILAEGIQLIRSLLAQVGPEGKAPGTEPSQAEPYWLLFRKSATPLAMCRPDGHGRFLDCNTRFCEVFGCTPEELQKETPLSFTREYDAENTQRVLALVSQPGLLDESSPLEVVLTNKHQQRFLVRVSSLLDDYQKPRFLLFTPKAMLRGVNGQEPSSAPPSSFASAPPLPSQPAPHPAVLAGPVAPPLVPSQSSMPSSAASSSSSLGAMLPIPISQAPDPHLPQISLLSPQAPPTREPRAPHIHNQPHHQHYQQHLHHILQQHNPGSPQDAPPPQQRQHQAFPAAVQEASSPSPQAGRVAENDQKPSPPPLPFNLRFPPLSTTEAASVVDRATAIPRPAPRPTTRQGSQSRALSPL
ncbi:pas-domain protein [Nannochloropsis gaditana]|uniref:Pas-domain protein n=1 Tax=Nannochloropsis gaditana TaxID=72520 RepID=W7U6Z7_9STRA|nr:pas-domain protein [Nannochloropsis gaditana]